MDLVFRKVRLDDNKSLVDVAIERGKIADIGPDLIAGRA